MPLKTTHLIYTTDENAGPVPSGLVFTSDGIGGGTWSTGGGGTAGTSGTSGTSGVSTGLVASNYLAKGIKNGSTQTITSGSDFVVTFVDEFDPQNWISSNKFQPTIEGYYNIQVAVWWNGGSVSTGQNNIQLRKNGSTQVAIQQVQISNGDGYGQEIDIIVFFNGSTDYVEVTAYTSNPTSQDINGAASGTWITGSLLTGVSTTSGTSGGTGTSGAAGTSGTSGNGTSGTSGVSGSSGTSGIGSGGSGTSGTSGTGFNSITNPLDNRILTSLGTTNTANAEANLTFDGTRLSVTGSAYIGGTSSVLTVVGSSSNSTIFSAQGSSGELFNVNDSLVGSLFSVNDISGLPILEVFSDDTTIIGAYKAQSLYTTKRVTVTASATASIYSFATASYTSAHVDYNISSGTNSRAGTLTSVWQGGSITYIENSTMSLGTTSGFTFSFIISGTYAVLQAFASSSTWDVKTIIRSI
jgi:collagen type VII alpha